MGGRRSGGGWKGGDREVGGRAAIRRRGGRAAIGRRWEGGVEDSEGVDSPATGHFKRGKVRRGFEEVYVSFFFHVSPLVSGGIGCNVCGF